MDISIVVPVYNEEENLPRLIPHLADVLRKVGRKFEIILVDDGSVDSSIDIIKNLITKYKEISYLRFIRNCGQTAAIDAGFKTARGDIVITLDGDLQNDPEDIPGMLTYIPEYDIVCGWRVDRQDSLVKKISSRIGNGFRRNITGDRIHDTGCSLKIYKREWLKRIKLFKGMHRFLPVLLQMEGARIIEVKVNHKLRQYGKSKYNIRNRLFAGLYDLLAVRWMQKRALDYQIGERS